jgi:hypothetical protein
MMMRTNERRIDRLEAAMQGGLEQVGKLVMICPDEWPVEEQLRYREARATGNRDLQFDIIEAVTGERPVYHPGRICVICSHRPAGV